MQGVLFVGIGLVLGLRWLGSGGAWSLGWGGAFGVGLLLWPVFALGYASLKRLLVGSAEDRADETWDTAWEALLGLPTVGASVACSLLVLGGVRFMGSFDTVPRGGFTHFLMSLLALHLLAWGGAALAQWALAARRGLDD